MSKLKFKNGVGPCSDCHSDVNINSEVPTNSPKVLCPQCQSNYLVKQKVDGAIDKVLSKKYPQGIILNNQLKKELGIGD